MLKKELENRKMNSENDGSPEGKVVKKDVKYKMPSN